MRTYVRRRGRKSERGQMLVETAIIMPIMVFVVLGSLQLVMMEHGRVMTEYAAFNATRAGIVHNGDWNVMQNAAMLGALPLYGRTDKLGSPADCLDFSNIRLCQSFFQCWCRVKLASEGTAAIDQTLGTLEHLVDDLLGLNILGGLTQDLSLIEINVTHPNREAIRTANAWKSRMEAIAQEIDPGGKLDYPDEEIDFDDLAMMKEHPELSRLGVEVRVLFPLRVPVINKIFFELWLAHVLLNARTIKSDITEWAQWRARLDDGRYLDEAVAAAPDEGPLSDFFSTTQWIREVRTLRWVAENWGLYLIPLRASYAMQMQSNFFEEKQREPTWFSLN